MTHLGRRLLHVFLHQGFSNLHGAIGLHQAAMYPDFNRLYCAAPLKAWPWKSDPLLRQPAETTKKDRLENGDSADSTLPISVLDQARK